MSRPKETRCHECEMGAVGRFAARARPRGKRAECPISAWVPADSRQKSPFSNALVEVEFQHPCGCLRLRCQRLDYGASKQEVVIPALAPRVEETHERPTPGIDRANVAPFPRIASNTGIREVAGIRRSAVLTTNDVVDLMRRIRIVFVKKTILTAVRGAFCDESAQWLVYVSWQAVCVAVPALWP